MFDTNNCISPFTSTCGAGISFNNCINTHKYYLTFHLDFILAPIFCWCIIENLIVLLLHLSPWIISNTLSTTFNGCALVYRDLFITTIGFKFNPRAFFNTSPLFVALVRQMHLLIIVQHHLPSLELFFYFTFEICVSWCT